MTTIIPSKGAIDNIYGKFNDIDYNINYNKYYF